MIEKRYVLFNRKDADYILDNPNTSLDFIEMLGDALSSEEIVDRLNEQEERIKELATENEQLKEGMIGVVDRYIKNVECNPPSSARTYSKIKRALNNIREDLRDLRGNVE